MPVAGSIGIMPGLENALPPAQEQLISVNWSNLQLNDRDSSREEDQPFNYRLRPS